MTFWVFFAVVIAVMLGFGVKCSIKANREGGEEGMTDVMGMFAWFGGLAIFVVVSLVAHFL